MKPTSLNSGLRVFFLTAVLCFDFLFSSGFRYLKHIKMSTLFQVSPYTIILKYSIHQSDKCMGAVYKLISSRGHCYIIHVLFVCFFFGSTIVSQAERIYQCMFNLIQQSKKITRNSLNALLQMTLTRHIRLALTLW